MIRLPDLSHITITCSRCLLVRPGDCLCSDRPAPRTALDQDTLAELRGARALRDDGNL